MLDAYFATLDCWSVVVKYVEMFFMLCMKTCVTNSINNVPTMLFVVGNCNRPTQQARSGYCKGKKKKYIFNELKHCNPRNKIINNQCSHSNIFRLFL